ncbi:hypothetical protein KY316_02405 [Candidatus Woesearchaeota archaeon]|nr:hypothetical protein [Candidatus Woesearchaeota archaeon]
MMFWYWIFKFWHFRREKVLGAIESYTWFGIIAAILALVDPYTYGVQYRFIPPINLTFAGIILSLVVGIYFRNKVPAQLLPAFSVIELISFVALRHEFTPLFAISVVIRLFFLLMFLRGMRAVFVYHKRFLEKPSSQ